MATAPTTVEIIPKGSPQKTSEAFLWGEEEPRNERAFAGGRKRGIWSQLRRGGGASLEFMEGKALPGVVCLLDK